MKIVIPGGTGQVGTVLARAFHAAGHEVVVLSRAPKPKPWRVVGWDGGSAGSWIREIDGADIVINLAGRSVNCRYNGVNRREMIDSRALSTRIVGQAIGAAPHPPRLWLQASTATIYAHRFDAPNDEYSGILGGQEPDAPDTWRFSIEVAQAWERTFNDAVTPSTRKIAMRSAMTMSPDAGGVFDTLLTLVRYGLGGRSGDGRQFVSWIHYEDFIAAIRWLIDHEELDGVVNLASPNPLPNAELMRAIRAAWGMPIGLPASEWMLEVGAVLLKTESELILKSRRVVPARLLETGFRFRYPVWPDAAEGLCAQVRQQLKAA